MIKPAKIINWLNQFKIYQFLFGNKRAGVEGINDCIHFVEWVQNDDSSWSAYVVRVFQDDDTKDEEIGTITIINSQSWQTANKIAHRLLDRLNQENAYIGNTRGELSFPEIGIGNFKRA